MFSRERVGKTQFDERLSIYANARGFAVDRVKQGEWVFVRTCASVSHKCSPRGLLNAADNFYAWKSKTVHRGRPE